MKKIGLVVVSLLFALFSIAYWRKVHDPLYLFQSSPELTLYSLNPDLLSPESEQQLQRYKKGKFHKYVVLGSTTVDKNQKQKILDVISAGIAHPGLQATCFMPRHGIRALNGNRTIDVLICFECGYIQFFVDGRNYGTRAFTQKGQNTFDRLLQNAQVPLAKGLNR